VSSLHELLTLSDQYRLENKWEFLKAAARKEIPVSPWLEIEDIVVKDKNEEGGMGIHMFRNALHGGNWIIQPKLKNHPILDEWLPVNAPLSTFRVVTVSSHCQGFEDGKLPDEPELPKSCVMPATCVFRAGLANAKTDHHAVFFDLDLNTGEIVRGTSNKEWYRLGFFKACCDIRNSFTDEAIIPDFRCLGKTVPQFKEILAAACEAHHKLLVDVPTVGWDVALTDAGPVILEANLSCNFFKGTFNRDLYLSFVDNIFSVYELNVNE